MASTTGSPRHRPDLRAGGRIRTMATWSACLRHATRPRAQIIGCHTLKVGARAHLEQQRRLQRRELARLLLREDFISVGSCHRQRRRPAPEHRSAPASNGRWSRRQGARERQAHACGRARRHHQLGHHAECGLLLLPLPREVLLLLLLAGAAHTTASALRLKRIRLRGDDVERAPCSGKACRVAPARFRGPLFSYWHMVEVNRAESKVCLAPLFRTSRVSATMSTTPVKPLGLRTPGGAQVRCRQLLGRTRPRWGGLLPSVVGLSHACVARAPKRAAARARGRGS